VGIIDKPTLLTGQVMHKRLFPRVNQFVYGMYYYALPLSHLDNLPIKRNHFGAISFYDSDHGACDGSDLDTWVRDLLKTYDVHNVDGEIILVCMPRIFGYVFNPVSFWLCHDRGGNVRAVIYEVNNTFGERHSYICAHPEGQIITKDDVITGQKVFHVSPFMQREGNYEFRLALSDKKLAVYIDYFDEEGVKKLLTSFVGDMQPLTQSSARMAFWKYPLVTIKAITLIHWQAIKIIAKKIPYISKPLQLLPRHSAAQELKKCNPQDT
jgi:hypothetical protein